MVNKISFYRCKLFSAILAPLIFLYPGLLAARNPTKPYVRVNVISSSEEQRAALNSELMSEQFQQTLDAVSNSERTVGNQAELLISGRQSYMSRFALIDQAKRSIVISTFSVYAPPGKKGSIADSITTKLVDKLIAAKKRGVEVLFLSDGGTSILANSQRAIDQLKAAGISVLKYNPIVGQRSDMYLLKALPWAIYRQITNHSPLPNRWHEKTMIVDGEYAIIGGINWGDLYDGNSFSLTYTDPKSFYGRPLIQEIGIKPFKEWGQVTDKAWRDTDLLVKGPVVSEMQEQMLLDFSIIEKMSNDRFASNFKDPDSSLFQYMFDNFKLKYQNNPIFFPEHKIPNDRHQVTARYIIQRPYLYRDLKLENEITRQAAEELGAYYFKESPLTHVSNYYVNVINKAQRQILWGCHSNKPTPDILNALALAAARGVNIYIIGNSREAAKTLPDFGLMMYPRGLCNYRKLLKAGRGKIRIFEWQRTAVLNGQKLTSGAFHSKLFAVDGVLASLGSYNLAPASFNKHTEGTVVITDPTFAHSAEVMFQNDLEFTREVDLSKVFDVNCTRNASERL